MENNYNISCGNKILRSFSLFTNREEKLDKAMNFYRKAFKEFIEKKDFWNYAILSEKIGDEYLKINNSINALSNYKNAQKYYSNMDIDKFISLTIDKIIPLYIDTNNVKNIGKCYYALAKLYKDDIHNTETEDYFEKAISYLEIDKSSELLSCHIDFTHYLLDRGNIDYAICNLEQIINQMCESTMLLFKVNEYMFLLSLCIMTKEDFILLQKKIDEYCELNYKFINFPGYKLIEYLIKVYEDNDIDKFTDYVCEYDKNYKLKPQEVKLLLIVKNKLKSNYEVDLT